MGSVKRDREILEELEQSKPDALVCVIVRKDMITSGAGGNFAKILAGLTSVIWGLSESVEMDPVVISEKITEAIKSEKRYSSGDPFERRRVQ